MLCRELYLLGACYGLHGHRSLSRCRRDGVGCRSARRGSAGGAIFARAPQDILDHELGLHATLPVLGNRLKHQVNHAIACAQLIYVRRAEHNRGHTCHAIRRRKAHMVARAPHACAILHGHAGSRQQGHFVPLAKGLKQRDLLNGVDIKLRKRNGGGNLARIFKRLGWQIRKHMV